MSNHRLGKELRLGKNKILPPWAFCFVNLKPEEVNFFKVRLVRLGG